jgi:hypothetical protein
MKADLTPSQVRALLVVASNPRVASARAWNNKIARIERHLGDLIGASAGPGSELLNEAMQAATPVHRLRSIKEVAKALIKKSVTRHHRDAARLLYHTAVAAAAVHHAEPVSGRPMHEQQDVYERLAAAWTGHPLGRLFEGALARAAANSEGPE